VRTAGPSRSKGLYLNPERESTFMGGHLSKTRTAWRSGKGKLFLF